MKLRILLADDHKILREGLRGILERDVTFHVIAEADTGERAVRLAAEKRPDIIIMDISMPDLNGIDATRQILRNNPEQKVLALSVHTDRRYVTRMLDAGARGYLRKDCASRELIDAIQRIAEGEIYVSAELGEGFARHRPGEDHVAELTPRERQVLQLVAEGNTTRQIADKLAVSVKAVEKYRHTIMEKLDLHTIADLTRYAINDGMISPEQ